MKRYFIYFYYGDSARVYCTKDFPAKGDSGTVFEISEDCMKVDEHTKGFCTTEQEAKDLRLQIQRLKKNFPDQYSYLITDPLHIQKICFDRPEVVRAKKKYEKTLDMFDNLFQDQINANGN